VHTLVLTGYYKTTFLPLLSRHPFFFCRYTPVLPSMCFHKLLSSYESARGLNLCDFQAFPYLTINGQKQLSFQTLASPSFFSQILTSVLPAQFDLQI